MQSLPVALTVDARGLSCPMPIIRARKAIGTIAVGDILELRVTDKGAPSDFRAWCQQTDHKFLESSDQDGYTRLLIKKLVSDTKEAARQFPHEISNDDLVARLKSGQPISVIDVREADEYAAGHIPGAIAIPIESIEDATVDLDPALTTAVVCRSGRRSDYACQILARKGFDKVLNVVPGMVGWTGSLTK